MGAARFAAGLLASAVALAGSSCALLLDEEALVAADGAVAACPGNLIVDPGFELGTSGWKGVNATLTWSPGGRDGSTHAALLCQETAGSSFRLDDYPELLEPPAAGARYFLGGWATADPEPAVELRAQLREDGPSGYDEGSGSSVQLTQEWQWISVSHSVIHDDAESVAVWLRATSGTCFRVDDVCLRREE